MAIIAASIDIAGCFATEIRRCRIASDTSFRQPAVAAGYAMNTASGYNSLRAATTTLRRLATDYAAAAASFCSCRRHIVYCRYLRRRQPLTFHILLHAD